MAHKRVHVKKGKRLPHGYNTIKAKNKNEVYGSKDVHIDKGYRIRHGVKTIPAADPNAYYEKGGTVKSIEEQIYQYRQIVINPMIPQDEKDFATSEISKLKARLSKMKSKPAKKKAPSKKAKSKPVAAKPSYDADSLLKAARERSASRKK